jgi:hypothetical protein
MRRELEKEAEEERESLRLIELGLRAGCSEVVPVVVEVEVAVPRLRPAGW